MIINSPGDRRVVITWPLVAGSLAALSFLSGCASHEATHRDIGTAIQEWRRPRAAVARANTVPAADRAAAARQPSADQPSTDGSLESYVSAALKRNPGLQAAAATVRARLQRIPQVMSLPDPVLRSVVRPEPIQTAAGDMYFTLGVSQTIPLLAKLERAGDIAAADARAALEQLNTKRVQLIADVERAYWQVYRLDRYLEITRENRRVLQDLEGVVETQYQVGKVLQQDLLRVQTELAKLRDDEHRFTQRRSAAVAALNQLADLPPQKQLPMIQVVDPLDVRADVDQLIALASEHSPQLAMLREQIEGNRQRVELTKLGYWPDLTVGAEWNQVDGREPFIPPINPNTGMQPPINRKSEAGDDNWAITVQMNLPIWTQRIEAAKREARQELLASQGELHVAENMVAFRVFEAWSRVEAQQHTLQVLATELIPQSQQTYEVTLTAYQAGDADFVTLIDNWRRWLDFQLMRHRETVDLETAYADLQREVGLQLVREGSGEGS